jgi:hypothetical protein
MTTQLTYSEYQDDFQQRVKSRLFPEAIEKIKKQLTRRAIAYRQIGDNHWEQVEIKDVESFCDNITDVSHYQSILKGFTFEDCDGYKWSLRKC